MSEIESAWPRYPGYRIDAVPWSGRARICHHGVVLADTDAALVVSESDHVDQLYVPAADVRWEHLVESDHHTICPFKGEADYWSLIVDGSEVENVMWAYRDPFPEVAALSGHVAFYPHLVEVELDERWPDGTVVTHRFPPWGDLTELAALLDVRAEGEGRFTSPPHPDPPIGTFLDIPDDRRPRQVVEGGHLLGQAIVAASRSVLDQRVVSASMTFTRAARFDAPLELGAEVARRGRTYSTVETRTSQHDRLCSIGLVLLDGGADDVIRGSVDPPDVPGPGDCPPLDFGVLGRELRVVDGAYHREPDEVGPAELHTWIRLRDRPADPAVAAALIAQPTTHFTIAAAMRPHRGVTEALAHVSLSTGPMAVEVAFHDDADPAGWLLYSNPAVYAGRGHVQGQGRVFTRDGRLVATYSVHAMVRAMLADPSRVGGTAAAM